MCRFFSCVSTGNGKPIYFDWELRKKVLSGELKNYKPDSHTSIADYFGYKSEKEDVLNKYEYNPLTKAFTIDQQNAKEKDHIEIQEWLQKIDWKTIAEPLIIKPIINPFTDLSTTEVAPEDLELLKKWASVWDSVWASVWTSVRASVWTSVRDSVRDSVWASVRDSVWASVWDLVGASVWDSVWDSVGDSVRDSVRDSVWASVWTSVGVYISSYFSIDYEYDFSSAIQLWEKGLVPSFDGNIWRLHGHMGFGQGKILWEGKL